VQRAYAAHEKAVEQHYRALLSGEEQPDVDALLFDDRSAWLPHDPAAVGTPQRKLLPKIAS